MSDNTTTQCLLLPAIHSRRVVAQFDQRHGSSDGGALLLKAADRRYELIAILASCLRDERQAGKVDHTLEELLAQRVFAMLAATRTRTTRPGWRPTPFTSCCWDAIRWRATTWRRSPRCRASKTPSTPRNSIA